MGQGYRELGTHDQRPEIGRGIVESHSNATQPLRKPGEVAWLRTRLASPRTFFIDNDRPRFPKTGSLSLTAMLRYRPVAHDFKAIGVADRVGWRVLNLLVLIGQCPQRGRGAFANLPE